MKLVGGWLPFIGFREEEVTDPWAREFLELPDNIKKVNTFQVEWLHIGFIWVLLPKPEEDE